MAIPHRYHYCRGCKRVQSSGRHYSTCRATDPVAPTSNLQARAFLLLMPASPGRDLNPELLNRVHLAPLPFYPRTNPGRSCRAFGGCGKSALEVCMAHFPTRGMRNNEGEGRCWGKSSNHNRAYSGENISKGKGRGMGGFRYHEPYRPETQRNLKEKAEEYVRIANRE